MRICVYIGGGGGQNQKKKKKGGKKKAKEKKKIKTEKNIYEYSSALSAVTFKGTHLLPSQSKP